MTLPLVVVGAAGFGRELLDVVAAINDSSRCQTWDVLGVVDDGPSAADRERLDRRGVKYLGGLNAWLGGRESIHVAVGIGDPSIRRKITGRLVAVGHEPATLVHPSATIGFGTGIGEGTVICAGVQVSTEVRLGPSVHLNPNATVGHDSQLAAFVSVNPGAVVSGACELAEGCLIGAGAVVLQGRRIGAGAVVGAAACVTRDVAENAVVKGIPAR